MLHVFGPLILLIFQMLESQNPHQWVKMDFYGDIVLFLRVLSTKHAGFTYENCCLVCLILYVISLWAYTSSSNTLLCSVYTSAINSRLYKIQRYYIKKKQQNTIWKKIQYGERTDYSIFLVNCNGCSYRPTLALGSAKRKEVVWLLAV